jgi:Cthe_2314-like HEPN
VIGRPAFIEHQAIACFLPYLESYVLKGLQEVNPNGGQFEATERESYAANVFERIGELDNAVKSLRLAMGFVTDLKNTHEDAPEVYRYHYENFLLRLTGLVDRAHRLVGASLLLCPSRLKKIGANEFVEKEIASDYPELLECLRKLTTVSAKHKTSRNKVAHSKAFSTRELGLFSAVVSLNLKVGDKTQINELMNGYFSEGGAELALLVAEMVTGIEELLDALAPIYDYLFAGNA